MHAVHLVHRMFLHEPVGQSGRMCQEMTYRDFTLCRDDGEIVCIAIFEHGHVFELGHINGHRIVQLEHALFIHHHQTNGCNRFGHRVDPENGILFERSVALYVTQTIAMEVSGVPPASNHNGVAR